LSKLKQQPGSGDTTLEDLVALVEEAACTLVDLRTENAALTKELREHQMAAQSEAAERDIRRQQIEELERSEAALKDAHAASSEKLAAAQMASHAKASELDAERQRREALEQSVAALKAENAALTKQVQEAQMAVHAKASELDIRRQRIHVLDQSIAALRKDAEFGQWMRSKFGNSSFFNHIEKLYFGDQSGEKKTE
jgi:chromosome segregation ATPase